MVVIFFFGFGFGLVFGAWETVFMYQTCLELTTQQKSV